MSTQLYQSDMGAQACSWAHVTPNQSWEPMPEGLVDTWHNDMKATIIEELELMGTIAAERTTMGIMPEQYAEIMAGVRCESCGTRLDSGHLATNKGSGTT